VELKLIGLKDLDSICVVGKGAFGMVKLMKHKETGAAYALKILQKKQLVQTKQCRNVINEKRIMHRIKHPFCITLCATMKDRDCLYLLMEFLQGGDMFTKLCDLDGHFEMTTARYYAASVLSAFAYIHAKNIVYRDLKPENLVFDGKGTLNVVDFGMAKIVKQRTYTVCGTPEYMAPEIINGRGHDQGADYWALGVLCYEMLYGQTPFADPSNNHLKIYKKINRSKVVFPTWADVGQDAPDLILALLKRMVFKRLGCLKNGAQGIKNHKWFTGGSDKLSFEKLERLEIQAPLQPSITDPFDVSNFDDWTDEDQHIEKFTADNSDYIQIWEAEF
jgi:serine/threonine protein kinase